MNKRKTNKSNRNNKPRNEPGRSPHTRSQKPKALPAIYYQPPSSYWREDETGKWIKINAGSAKRFVEFAGYTATRKGGISEVEKCIQDIQTRQNIAYAGPLAGHKAGHHYINNVDILVTSSPRLFAPKRGKWPNLNCVLNGLFRNDPHEQLHYLFGWLKRATESVYSGTWAPGQMLAIVGPVDAGKSLLQNLITSMLGGRGAKPYQFMSSTTAFNLDLFQAEHLMLEDEREEVSPERRRQFAAQIKSLCVNRSQRCHGKNRDGLTLTPIWRLSCSVNDHPERLLVLPPLDDDVADKVIILKVIQAQMPMPTNTPEEYEALMGTLESELPAFLHFLTKWKVPDHIRSSRFGVKAYHHPDVVDTLWRATPEAVTWALINDVCFADTNSWQGTVGQLKDLLLSDKGLGNRPRNRGNLTVASLEAVLAKLSENSKFKDCVTRVTDVDKITWLLRKPQASQKGMLVAAPRFPPKVPRSHVKIAATQRERPLRKQAVNHSRNKGKSPRTLQPLRGSQAKGTKDITSHSIGRNAKLNVLLSALNSAVAETRRNQRQQA